MLEQFVVLCTMGHVETVVVVTRVIDSTLVLLVVGNIVAIVVWCHIVDRCRFVDNGRSNSCGNRIVDNC